VFAEERRGIWGAAVAYPCEPSGLLWLLDWDMLREREKGGTGSIDGRSMVTGKVCFSGNVYDRTEKQG